MKGIPLTEKLYVWSVVLEPLLFFIIWDEWVTGIGGNVSRMLQGIVVITLVFRHFMNPTRLRIMNPVHPFYQNYAIYLGIAIFAGLLSGVFGAYEVPLTKVRENQSYFAGLLN